MTVTTTAIIATEEQAEAFMAEIKARAAARKAAAPARKPRVTKAEKQLVLMMEQYTRDVAANPNTTIWNPTTRNFDAYRDGAIIAQADTYLAAEAARLAHLTRDAEGAVAVEGPTPDRQLPDRVEWLVDYHIHADDSVVRQAVRRAPSIDAVRAGFRAERPSAVIIRIAILPPCLEPADFDAMVALTDYVRNSMALGDDDYCWLCGVFGACPHTPADCDTCGNTGRIDTSYPTPEGWERDSEACACVETSGPTGLDRAVWTAPAPKCNKIGCIDAGTIPCGYCGSMYCATCAPAGCYDCGAEVIPPAVPVGTVVAVPGGDTWAVSELAPKPLPTCEVPGCGRTAISHTVPWCGCIIGENETAICLDCGDPLASGAQHDTSRQMTLDTCTLCDGQGVTSDEDGVYVCHHGALMIHAGLLCEARHCEAPAMVVCCGMVFCADHRNHTNCWALPFTPTPAEDRAALDEATAALLLIEQMAGVVDVEPVADDDQVVRLLAA